MLIEWNKETDNRYTATWRGSFLVLKYFNRCWRVIVRHIADGHICCPPNRWQDLATAKQDIDVKALRAVMTYATPVAHQKSLPVRSVAVAAVKRHLATGERPAKQLAVAQRPGKKPELLDLPSGKRSRSAKAIFANKLGSERRNGNS